MPPRNPIRKMRFGLQRENKAKILIGRRVLLLARRGQIYLQGQYGKSLQKRKRHVPSQSHDTQRENSKSCRKNGFPLNKRTLDFFLNDSFERVSRRGTRSAFNHFRRPPGLRQKKKNFCYKKKTLVLLFVLNCPKAHI